MDKKLDMNHDSKSKRVRREGSMLHSTGKQRNKVMTTVSIFDISKDEEVMNSGSILSPNQATLGISVDLSEDEEIVNSASPHMTLGVLNDEDNISEQLIFTPDGHVGTGAGGALHEY